LIFHFPNRERHLHPSSAKGPLSRFSGQKFRSARAVGSWNPQVPFRSRFGGGEVLTVVPAVSRRFWPRSDCLFPYEKKAGDAFAQFGLFNKDGLTVHCSTN
jgi:hypothetical protein